MAGIGINWHASAYKWRPFFHRRVPAANTGPRKGVLTLRYLADILVKSGASTVGGNLTPVDFDLLMPKNVGLHRLGLPFSFSNKALGLSVILQNDASGISVHALEVGVRDAHLGDIDVLIDATGEEALGHWLSAHYASSPGKHK